MLAGKNTHGHKYKEDKNVQLHSVLNEAVKLDKISHIPQSTQRAAKIMGVGATTISMAISIKKKCRLVQC
ncbi:MAG: hypothetical protein RLZZ419_1140 [Pseudomonadota bacterium]